MNKKDILLIVVSFFAFLLVLFLMVSIGNIFRNIFNYSSIFYLIFILICISLPIITLLYYIYLNNKEVKKYEKLAQEEYNKNKNYIYYRDKIKNYSPAVLAYCYNKKYDFKKVLIATLLDLSLKDYIKFENNKILVLNNDWTNLEEHEKYILELIQNNNLITLYDDKKNRKYLHTLIKKETHTKFFIRIKHFVRYKNYYEKSFAFIFVILILISFTNFFVSLKGSEAARNILLYLITIIFGIISDKIFKKLFDKLYKRNDTAIDILSKLICIKKFLSEFSSLKDKSIKEIELWEDYMIYTLILDIDGDINKSINDFIDIYIKN